MAIQKQRKYFFSILYLALLPQIFADEDTEENRLSKALPVFQVVRFPNDICIVSGGAKNGTCYTAEECSNKGGLNAGSCASGFGVCCTFTLGCGGSSSENCTYFENTSPVSGECTASICKQSNVCQLRLDFDTFVLSGPSTVTTSSAALKHVAGTFDSANGAKAVSLRTKCATDTFSVNFAPGVPTLCGTLSGDHIYFDAAQACHDLSFNFGQAAQGLSSVSTTRQFSVKVTQIPCTSKLLAPNGCLQYYFGATEGLFKTFNFDNNIHLANQNQVICFRREQGRCQICYNADSITDIILSGKGTKGVTKQQSGTLACCSYGVKGTAGQQGYDCVMIPGAMKKTGTVVKAACQAGGAMGLVTQTGTIAATVCSKAVPFRVEFITDGFEIVDPTNAPGEVISKGAKLRYVQNTC